MSSDRVLVVGAGIAGLSCAIALRAHGYPVDILELTGEVEQSSIMLSGRSVDALADLGVLDECRTRANATATPTFGHVFESDGARRPAAMAQEPYDVLPDAVHIYRPVLLDVLRTAALASGAVLRQPCTVRTIVRFTECVLVSFDNGATGEYELVVGADGIRSTVRELVWGNGITPNYAGALGIRWLAGPMSPVEPGFYFAPGKTVVVGELPGEEAYVATFALTDDVRPTQEQAREMLRDVLGAYSAPYLRRLREHLDDTQHVSTVPWEWLWVPTWYEGRIVLIGDAAHATAPYVPAGGGMALIDSVVLADELAGADSVHEGLAAFVHRRRERARLVVSTSVELTKLYQSGESHNAGKILASALRLLAQPY